jgi:hypothetical protein
LEAAAPGLKPLFRALFEIAAPVTRKMIDEKRLAWLKQLPIELRFEISRHENLVLTHAGPGNIWRAPMDTANDAELESTYKVFNAEIVVYCHIHRPFVRRVAYDVEKEVSRLMTSDYPLKEWIAETRRRGSYVPPPENLVS